MNARYYWPAVGRFITRDAFHGFEDEPLSLNQYNYAHSNPVMYVDPSGYNPAAAWAIRTAIIVAKNAFKRAYGTLKNIRVKVELHGPHHYFGWPFYSKRRHVMVLVYIKGKKGWRIRTQIPY